jgi:hypothetical protein
MATGMVSSAHNLQSAPAPVIRAGERIATAAAALKDKNARAYHHMVPGAKFVMPDGLEIVFMGGHFITADPDIIAELDRVADKPASMIYTRKESVAAAETLQQQSAAEAAGN